MEHLGARTRPGVHRIQHLGGEGAVAHASMPPPGGLPSGLTVTDSGRGRNQRQTRGPQEGNDLLHKPFSPETNWRATNGRFAARIGRQAIAAKAERSGRFMPSHGSAERWKTLLAFASIYFVW